MESRSKMSASARSKIRRAFADATDEQMELITKMVNGEFPPTPEAKAGIRLIVKLAEVQCPGHGEMLFAFWVFSGQWKKGDPK